MRGTEEKGVDVRIATDMIMLAWVDSYDAAVLVSADADFVPVAQFLQTKGKKVVHAQFPPKGSHLSQKCWGSIDMTQLLDRFRLPPPKKPATTNVAKLPTTGSAAQRSQASGQKPPLGKPSKPPGSGN